MNADLKERDTQNFKQQLDIITITNDEYQLEKPTSGKESDLLNIWRPVADALRTFSTSQPYRADLSASIVWLFHAPLQPCHRFL